MLSCPRISSLMSATREGHRGNVHKRIVAALLSHRGFYWFSKKRTQWRLFFDKTQLLGCDRCGYSTRRAQQLHMYPQAGTLHCTAHCHPMWVRQYNGVQNCTENCTVARRYINQSKKWFRCVTVLTVLTVEGFAETKHHSKLNFVKSWVAKGDPILNRILSNKAY